MWGCRCGRDWRIGGSVMEMPNLPAIRALRPAWDKGRIVGQKYPLTPKHVWAVRIDLDGVGRRLGVYLRTDQPPIWYTVFSTVYGDVIVRWNGYDGQGEGPAPRGAGSEGVRRRGIMCLSITYCDRPVASSIWAASVRISWNSKVTRGCPSVDPELMIRMLSVGCCLGIGFEPRHREEVHLNLACRRFCRADLNDRVPDHPMVSVNRRGQFVE